MARTLQLGLVRENNPYLKKLEHAHLDLLVLVLLLLGLGVGLLLAFLATTQQARQDVQGVLIRHACLGQHNAVLQLAPSEQQPLCIHSEACRQCNVSQGERSSKLCLSKKVEIKQGGYRGGVYYAPWRASIADFTSETVASALTWSV